MPFPRPTLTALNAQAAADITAALPPGAAPLLRFNNLGILGRVMSRFVNGLYGRLDYIARQATPWSVTDADYAAAWGALRGVYAKPATAASGVAPVSGSEGVLVPTGTKLIRNDGATFTTTADAVIVSGVAACPILAATLGAIGNTPAGSTLTLSSPIAGAVSTVVLTSALIGGLEPETPAAFRARYLARYAAPPQAGSRDDYPAWALVLPQITRAWVRPGESGSGALYVYVMLDVQNVATGGFPIGTDGVSTLESRGPRATGDQLAVADVIIPVQPAEALVYVCSPVASPVNVTISGMPLAKRPLVGAAIKGLFTAEATPGGVYLSSGATAGVMPLQRVWSAIYAATGYAAFQVVAPTTDIVTTAGRIPTLGALAFT